MGQAGQGFGLSGRLTPQPLCHGLAPNLIFVVADGLAHADLGCYGGRAAEFGAAVSCSTLLLHLFICNGERLRQHYLNHVCIGCAKLDDPGFLGIFKLSRRGLRLKLQADFCVLPQHTF